MNKLGAGLLALGMGCGSLFAQTNLVPNGDFSQIEKKVKAGGEIMKATGWWSASEENMADLYQEGNKKGFGVPENARGMQAAESGNSYAGIRAYSYNDKEPRTYLQVKLDKPLIEGKKYCVSFKASLSDMSKYGANNLGAYIGAQKLKEKNIEGYEIKPQVMHSRNQIMQDQFLFETICSVVSAKGGERYLVIGNFASPVEMKKKSNTVRLKRPSGFTGMQTQDAYYYIDDVQVINMEELTTCDCEPKDRNEMQVVHNENISETMDMSAEDIAATKKVFFDERSKEVSAGAQLAELIDLMNENPSMNVEIQGHTDKQEENDYLGNLSEERAKVVYDYMIEQGIDASRLSYVGMKDQSPADESGTRDSLAKNRRVSFKVK